MADKDDLEELRKPMKKKKIGRPKKVIPSAEKLKELYSLDTIDRQLIHYVINFPGMKNQEMAALLGICRETVRVRLKKPALIKALTDINQPAVELLQKAQAKAIRTLMQIIEDKSENTSIRVSACKIVLQPMINHASIDVNTSKEVTYKVRFGEQGQLFSEVIEAETEKQPTTMDLLQ